MTVSGLSCGTSYYFVVESETDPHTYNQNTVVSELSSEVSGSPALALYPPSPLPAGTQGQPYTVVITASGGTGPYTYTVSGGALPSGMTLSTDGTLSGTPAVRGQFSFVVSATDTSSCGGSLPYALSITPATDAIAGEGPDSSNTNRVRVYDASGVPTPVDFQAYSAGSWGTRICSGAIDGVGVWEIVTGPGPGAVFGPHVRAFSAIGLPISKVSFFAYATLKFGVNPGAGLLDGDVFDEIVSGAGPGAVFGPQVRGWNYDGIAVAPIPGVNYFAYATLRFGVTVGDGNVDGDAFDELLTGPGPGSSFGPQVRGWDYDGVALSAMTKINFLPPYTPAAYGVNVAGGDVDGDGFGEIATAPGPGASLPARFLGFDYDGVAIAPLPGFDVTPMTTVYGARLGLASLEGGSQEDLMAGAGPDPTADSMVSAYVYTGSSLAPLAGSFLPFGTEKYGVNVAGGILGL
ncbi:MAG: Ig domain-containing protein [Acidobacteriota bacterium]